MPNIQKFDKITHVKGTKVSHIGDSPSGKATDSDSVIRVFESLIPSHDKGIPSGMPFVVRREIRMRTPALTGVTLTLFRRYAPYARNSENDLVKFIHAIGRC